MRAVPRDRRGPAYRRDRDGRGRHTGIDDIREIIDAVRYASVCARYKIYIIDEVHMLSKGFQRLVENS